MSFVSHMLSSMDGEYRNSGWMIFFYHGCDEEFDLILLNCFTSVDSKIPQDGLGPPAFSDV